MKIRFSKPVEVEVGISELQDGGSATLTVILEEMESSVEFDSITFDDLSSVNSLYPFVALRGRMKKIARHEISTVPSART